MVAERAKPYIVLTANTLAFTACFSVWVMNGVLATFLDLHQIIPLTKSQVGWLIGAPILTGALLRLPAGMLTDRYGGRPVFTAVMLLAAGATQLMSWANDFPGLLLASLGMGIAGSSFAVGIGYTSVWFPLRWQGTALGIFGAGNAGAALTALVGPSLLDLLTYSGTSPDAWRAFPRLYAAVLAGVAVLFWLVTENRTPPQPQEPGWHERLSPLRRLRVWRFGLYYVLVFGGYVALAQWLIPYYVGAYSMSLATAGAVSLVFTLPGGVIRAFGGLLSDMYGARRVMYAVLGGTSVACLLLTVPRMDVALPGSGVLATRPGVVTQVAPDEVEAGGVRYRLRPSDQPSKETQQRSIWPQSHRWQEPAVTVGDQIQPGSLIARGVTHYYFDADVRVFTGLIMVVGLLMGIGKAAVYKYIPEYFPGDVGTVGGMVGVLGALGGTGFALAFGYALDLTGLWTSAWMILLTVAMCSLVWLHWVVGRMVREHTTAIRQMIENPGETILREAGQ